MIFYAAVAKRLLPNINTLVSSKIHLKGLEASVDIITREINRKTSFKPLLASEKKEFHRKIEFKDVCFSYPRKKQTVKNINFTLYKNQSIAFVGYSGSGKTTIIELITYLIGGVEFLHRFLPCC